MKNIGIAILVLFGLFVADASIGQGKKKGGPSTKNSVLVRGITEPFRDAWLGSVVQNRVSAIRAKKGDFVRQGDVIVELVSKKNALEVRGRKLIAKDQSELHRAEKGLEFSKMEYESTCYLFDNVQSVGKEELKKKELEYKMQQLSVEELLSREETEKINYEIAKSQLEDQFILAPFDGEIIEMDIEEGESRREHEEPFVRIVDVRKFRFIAHIEPLLARQLAVGQTVALQIGATGDPIVREGTIEYISPVVDPASSLQEIRVLSDNSDGLIPPGVEAAMLLNPQE